MTETEQNQPYLIVDGVVAAQTPKVQEVFRDVLPQFDLIIELGTYKGAFSLWLSQNMRPTTKFVTFERNRNVVEIRHRTEIDQRIGNCFSEDVKSQVKELIDSCGKSLILCDGGKKEREFREYAPLLKKGDVIMMHDYSHDPDDYEALCKVHNWPHFAESHFQNIENDARVNGLEPFMYDEFKTVFWGSFIKA